MCLSDKTSCQITDIKYRYFATWKKENRAWKIAYIITNKELPPRMLAEEETVAAQHAGATDESV